MDNNRSISLTKSSLLYGIGHTVPAGLTFLLITICALYLSPTDLGIIGLAEATAMVFSHLSIVALPWSLRRLFFGYKNIPQRNIFVSSVLRGGIVIASLGMLFSLTLGPVVFEIIPTDLPDFFPYFAYAIGYQIWYQFLEYRLTLFQVHERPVAYVILQLIVGISIFLCVTFLVVFMKEGAAGFLLGRLLAVSIVLVFVLFSMKDYFLFGWSSTKFQSALVFGIPLVPHVLSMTLLNFADRFILEIYSTTDVVGKYTLAYTLGLAMYMVTFAFSMSWGPFFFKTCQEGTQGLRRIGNLSGKATAIIFIIAVFGTIIAEDFVTLVFSAEYKSIAPIVPLIITGYLFHYLYSLFSFGVFQDKRTFYVATVTAIAATFNIVMNICLIPEFGIRGAAWSTIFAFAFEAIAIYWIAKRIFPVPYPMKKVFSFLLIYFAILFQSQYAPDNRLFVYIVGFISIVLILKIGFVIPFRGSATRGSSTTLD